MDELERKVQHFLVRGRHDVSAFLARAEHGANRRTLLISIVGGAVVLLLYLFVIQPPAQFPVDELVSIPQGTSLAAASEILKDDGVIRSPLIFRLLVTMQGAERTVHAGDYLFNEPLSVFEIAHAVALGQYGLKPVRIVVPEGSTAKQMSIIFASRLQKFDAKHFLEVAKPEEGYLFPDTYYFLPNATDSIVLQALRQNFDAHIEKIQPAIASSTHSLSDIITMASIVEREASDSTDRRLIAGVLWNRIAKGMPLQADSTLWYVLGKGTFQLTSQDLKDNSPYNTYVHKGLPPTPICNPSLDSIEAALDPTQNEYLYFLADKNGVTHYCKTYACQLANKAEYF